MNLEGDVSVIDAIKEKKRLMEAGDEHEHIKPLLIVDGGFMKGVYGVGAVLAMEEQGFLKTFSSYGGISSGAATLAYVLAGQGELGATVIWEECCSREFLSPWRWKNPEDSAFFKTVLQGSTDKKLNVSELLKLSNVYIGVTRFEDAAPVLLQPQTTEEWLDGVRASMSMPGAVTEPIEVQGVRYIDGASAKPLVLRKLVSEISATHVLVITNQDKDTRDILWWDRLISKTIWRRRYTQLLLRAALTRRSRRCAWVDEVLASQTKPICFVWGNNTVGSFERDSNKVKKAVEASRCWWRDLLAK